MASLPTLVNWTEASLTKEQVRNATEQARTYLAGLLGEDGTIATALATLGAMICDTVALSAATTVSATHRGKLLACSGTWTLSLTAAATLGDGFAFAARNTGGGTITIDPNASETIDGATTIALGAGESCICVCDGTAWYTVGRTALADGSVTTAKLANAAVTSAKLATGTAERDWVLARTASASAGAVGTFALAFTATIVLFGSTVSGSSLYPCDATGTHRASARSGTWMCLGIASYDGTTSSMGTTLWLRVA